MSYASSTCSVKLAHTAPGGAVDVMDTMWFETKGSVEADVRHVLSMFPATKQTGGWIPAELWVGPGLEERVLVVHGDTGPEALLTKRGSEPLPVVS